MLYRHRLVSASFILNAEVIEVWWQLADAHRFRLFFYFAQQFSSLFKNGNVCRKIFSHIVKHFQYVKNPLDIKKMSVRPGVRTQGSAQLRSIHATYKQSL